MVKEDLILKKEVNPELFKQKPQLDLKPDQYYAYIDSIEQVEGIINIRFDCIIKNDADNFQINKQTILEFPSIVIEINGDVKTIRSLFNYSNLYLLESNWLIIKTNLNKNETNVTKHFNFINVSNNLDYSIEQVTLSRDMDDISKRKISEIVTATTIEESSEKDILDFLNNLSLSKYNHIMVYNVGQGNCNGFVDENNIPLMYFDVGGGFGANKVTYPNNFQLCHSYNPNVILSHWDQDHFQTAIFDNQLLNTKWLVPKHSSISNTAMHIALELQKRNNLICWNNSLQYVDFLSHRIVKCTGNPNNKNNSGLAFYVNQNSEFVLLPADATFNKIPHKPLANIIGLVASHHGAKGSIQGMPDASAPAMLAFSFGRRNTHHHPHMQAVHSYIGNNWINTLDTTSGNIAMITTPLTMSVPCRNGKCSLEISQHF